MDLHPGQLSYLTRLHDPQRTRGNTPAEKMEEKRRILDDRGGALDRRTPYRLASRGLEQGDPQSSEQPYVPQTLNELLGIEEGN